MKFYVSTAFLETSEVVEIAKAADDLGYDGMGIPDHVINLETLKTPYPYTKDGKRRWEAFTDWPDPWVMIGAIALVTSRLRFVTTVYLPAMRDPYSAAKSIGTAAVLAGGRLERSEEHTSELQSRRDLVCRLLLEKKKQTYT